LNSAKKQEKMKEKNHKKYIDFFVSIVYDKIAKYGIPMRISAGITLI